MRDDATRPGWSTVVLVCKDCKKRRDAPNKMKTRAVVAEIKGALRDQRPRPRVVTSSCLGICPTGRLVVAAVGVEADARAVSVASLDEVPHAVRSLLAP